MINLALIFYQRSHLSINNYGRNHCHVFVSMKTAICGEWMAEHVIAYSLITIVTNTEIK